MRKPPPSRKGKLSGTTEFAYSICSSVRDGKPDMYNSVPKRVVTMEESKSHGWPWFYDGEWTCIQGHKAARYISNQRKCVDCTRIAEGLLPIYGGQSNMDLIGEAVASPAKTDELLNSDFRWNDERFRQFCVAYINSNDVERALKVVGALPYDLIQELRNNPERAAEFEAARHDADQVFLWKAEGSAASGSDRAMLARAGASFPDRFGSRSQSGLSERPYLNPDKAIEELAQLFRGLEQSLDQQDALGAPKATAKAVAHDDSGAEDGASVSTEDTVLLAPPHDNSDLVCDT